MRTVLCVMVLVAASLGSARAAPRLVIHVLGAETGGYDRTARAMAETLEADGSARGVRLVRSPGAGGLIALAQFLDLPPGAYEPDTEHVFIGGPSVVTAAAYNRAEVSLAQLEPIARVHATAIAISVPARSPLEDLDDLADALRSGSGAMSWIGGSEGTLDDLFVSALVEAVGAPQSRVRYLAVPGGGDGVAEALIADQAAVAVGSFEEFERFADDGRLRILAVTGPPGHVSGAPSLSGTGFEIDVTDWRGVFVHPDLPPGRVASVRAMTEALVASPAWKARLRRHGWQDAYLPATPFSRFLAAEERAAARDLAARATALSAADLMGTGPAGSPSRLVAALFALIAVGLLGVHLWTRRTLSASLERAQDQRVAAEAKLSEGLARSADHIERTFARWQLTAAEVEVGWMLLKGLALKAIADVRGTSERTVRQQARAVYAKADVENRSDLAAYFLEDFYLSGRTDAPGGEAPADATQPV